MRWQRAKHWLTTKIVFVALGLTACQSGPSVRPSPIVALPTPALPERLVHLVIDIGSSGTSLCLFPVQRASVPASTELGAQSFRRCSVGAIEPVCTKSKGGLAQLVIGKSQSEVTTLVMGRLRDAWRALGEPAPKGRPDWRSEVRSAAALAPIDHAFTHFDLRLHPLHVHCSRPGAVRDDDATLWYTLDAPQRVGLPQPIKSLLERLRESRVA